VQDAAPSSVLKQRPPCAAFLSPPRALGRLYLIPCPHLQYLHRLSYKDLALAITRRSRRERRCRASATCGCGRRERRSASHF